MWEGIPFLVHYLLNLVGKRLSIWNADTKSKIEALKVLFWLGFPVCLFFLSTKFDEVKFLWIFTAVTQRTKKESWDKASALGILIVLLIVLKPGLVTAVWSWYNLNLRKLQGIVSELHLGEWFGEKEQVLRHYQQRSCARWLEICLVSTLFPCPIICHKLWSGSHKCLISCALFAANHCWWPAHDYTEHFNWKSY